MRTLQSDAFAESQDTGPRKAAIKAMVARLYLGAAISKDVANSPLRIATIVSSLSGVGGGRDIDKSCHPRQGSARFVAS
jgi:hypothetical protein